MDLIAPNASFNGRKVTGRNFFENGDLGEGENRRASLGGATMWLIVAPILLWN